MYSVILLHSERAITVCSHNCLQNDVVEYKTKQLKYVFIFYPPKKIGNHFCIYPNTDERKGLGSAVKYCNKTTEKEIEERFVICLNHPNSWLIVPLTRRRCVCLSIYVAAAVVPC